MVGGPLLAIEVLSPSTRLVDLKLKFATYEREGTQGYWVVDPSVPSITAWQLGPDCYQEVTSATGDDLFEVTTPFPFSTRPADLMR